MSEINEENSINEDFLVGFVVGMVFCFLAGIFIATGDDITADQLAVAAKVCGGYNNISKVDPDGPDTFTCLNGKEYTWSPNPLFLSAQRRLEENERKELINKRKEVINERAE